MKNVPELHITRDVWTLRLLADLTPHRAAAHLGIYQSTTGSGGNYMLNLSEVASTLVPWLLYHVGEHETPGYATGRGGGYQPPLFGIASALGGRVRDTLAMNYGLDAHEAASITVSVGHYSGEHGPINFHTIALGQNEAAAVRDWLIRWHLAAAKHLRENPRANS